MLSVAVLVGCAATAVPEPAPSANSTAPVRTVEPEATVVPDGAVEAQQRVDDAALAAQAADRTGGVGVAVLDVAEGVLAGERADEPFYAASTVKILVAVDVLAQRADGVPVGEAERELLRAALGPSSDPAMNQLWTQFDGIGAISRVSEDAGLTGTTAPQDVSQWGNTLMTPTDVATLYRYVLTELEDADRELIIGAMSAATPVATDGFDQSFGLLAAGASATKQGWSCCLDGEVQLNSSGLVTGAGDEGTVVVLLSSQPRAPGYDGARAVLDAMAAAALESLATATA